MKINKIENNQNISENLSNIPTDNLYMENFIENISENNEIQNTENASESAEIQSIENILENTEIQNTENIIENNTSNCFALTIKEDYKLTSKTNRIMRSLRMSFKVFVSTLTLNIIKFFF